MPASLGDLLRTTDFSKPAMRSRAIDRAQQSANSQEWLATSRRGFSWVLWSGRFWARGTGERQVHQVFCGAGGLVGAFNALVLG
jgi:hypothetical protein